MLNRFWLSVLFSFRVFAKSLFSILSFLDNSFQQRVLKLLLILSDLSWLKISGNTSTMYNSKTVFSSVWLRRTPINQKAIANHRPSIGWIDEATFGPMVVKNWLIFFQFRKVYSGLILSSVTIEGSVNNFCARIFSQYIKIALAFGIVY